MDVAVDPVQGNKNYRVGNAAGAYRTQQVLSASPERLILMTYDYILAGCNTKDKTKVSRGLVELIDALDFSQSDIAMGLLKLYQYALDKVREGDFNGVISVLRPLRETWGAALQKPTNTAQRVG
ncbi:MAG: flagellar protein FliS [Firmicutes bacterium]|jgi:flagellin-specific chaperone FliS|nr:flagellar protein FliS [Bacillota bacterium]